jgi:3',5'-cyclic AMP phosphodiesterase CpdA
MRLVHISDLHFGAVHEGMELHLRTAILKANPAMVAVSGDHTMRGRKTEFLEAKTFFDSLPLPQLLVPGNHDVQGSWRLWERFFTPWANYRSILGANMEPVWHSPEMIVVGLNSARPAGWHLDWSRGRLSRQQMSRMSALYEAADPGALRVLVVHHPPAAPPHGTPRHLIGRLREFTDAVKAAGVDLVLSGHFHMSYAQVLHLPGDPAPASCVMSSVSTATSHRLKGEPNGFHVIDSDPGGLSIQDWAWTGSSYDQRRSWRFTASPGAHDWRLGEDPGTPRKGQLSI